MCRAPATWAWWHAVGAPLERGVRPHRSGTWKNGFMASSSWSKHRLWRTVGVVILSEKAPYVVTLFVAALGFVVWQTLDRYNRVPTLEYAVDRTAVLGDVASVLGAASTVIFPTTLPALYESGYTVLLTNISSTHVIRCVRVDLLLLPRAGGTSPVVSNWLSSTSGSRPVRQQVGSDKDRPSTTVLGMQPGQWVELRLNAKHVGSTSVLARACGSEEGVAEQMTDLPVIVPRSAATVFARHAFTLFGLGLLMWCAILVAAFVHRMKKSEPREA